MEGFPFVHRETVRFRDLDGMGHVNNAVFSTYLEQARLAWFGQDEEMPLRDVILARTEIDFRAQVGEGEIVDIGVRPVRVGAKSFERFSGRTGKAGTASYGRHRKRRLRRAARTQTGRRLTA